MTSLDAELRTHPSLACLAQGKLEGPGVKATQSTNVVVDEVKAATTRREGRRVGRLYSKHTGAARGRCLYGGKNGGKAGKG